MYHGAILGAVGVASLDEATIYYLSTVYLILTTAVLGVDEDDLWVGTGGASLSHPVQSHPPDCT